MAKKILLIDDDTYIRDLYNELLTSEGFEIDLAKDGATGLEKIQQGGYDLVLLDIMLPKIDGHGVLVKLKENPPQKPNGPIIILTNLANDPIVEESVKLGAKASYIKSDHTPEEFLNMIKKYLATDPQPAQ